MRYNGLPLSLVETIAIQKHVLSELPSTFEFLELLSNQHIDKLIDQPLDQFNPDNVVNDMARWIAYLDSIRPLVQWGREEFLSTLSIRWKDGGHYFYSPVDNQHAVVWKKLFFQHLGELYPSFGVFSHAEPIDREEPAPAGFRCSPQEKHTRNTPSREDRMTIGPRRRYVGAGYLTAARRLSVGLIEDTGQRLVVWLSEEEREMVCKEANKGRKV